MKVSIESNLSDLHLDARQQNTQRQLSLAISAIADERDPQLPLNLCLVLDRSGSMAGEPLESVKQAAVEIVHRLEPRDRLSAVAFNHQARVIVSHQPVTNTTEIEQQINLMVADGGTAIDRGMLLGIQQAAPGRQKNCVSRIFLLTDGENEHGNNQRCLQLAQLASEYQMTIDTLGFGEHWNQSVLEQIADSAKGTLAYIEQPERALAEFEKLFKRARAVGLIDAHLSVELMPRVRLASFKPVAQVAPETIELPVKLEGNHFSLHLGDLSCDRARVILINLYLDRLSPGTYQIASVRLRYDDPVSDCQQVYSDLIPIAIESQASYQPAPNQTVRHSILALAKYRQTQIAETKLQQGDLAGAATMLQTAATTCLQLGDELGATILQSNSTCLQQGKELSLGDRKKNLIVSKTVLEP